MKQLGDAKLADSSHRFFGFINVIFCRPLNTYIPLSHGKGMGKRTTVSAKGLEPLTNGLKRGWSSNGLFQPRAAENIITW
jgi:hypothetical protein